MRQATLLLCLALLPSLAAASDTHDLLVRQANALDAAIARAAADGPSAAESNALGEAVLRLDRQFQDAGPSRDETLARKAHALLGLREALRTTTQRAAEPTPPIRDIKLGEGAGQSCERAISLHEGEAIRHAVGARQSLWYRVDTRDDSALRVSTRGSTIDPALQAFSDCRVADRAPLASVDDSFGLQADLPLVPKTQTFWYVRADNLGGAGQLELSVVRAVVIGGRVARNTGNVPLAGVTVALFRAESSSPYYLATTNTLADGTYTFAVSGAGNFALRTGEFSYSALTGLLHEAYNGFACATVDPYYLGTCGNATQNFTPIAVADPGSASIDFGLDLAGSVVGTVMSSRGGPVAGARVSMHLQGSSYEQRATTADALGRYRFDGVPITPFYLVAQSDDHARTLYDGIECNDYYNCPWNAGVPVQVPPETLDRIDMTLRRQQFVEVSLTIDGAPVTGDSYYNGITVELLNGNAALVANGNTIAPGRYRMGPVAPGSYRMRVRSYVSFPQLYPAIECASDCINEFGLATPLVVGAADTTVAVAMDLRRYPRISGRLSSDGSNQPITGADVSLYRLGTTYASHSVFTDLAGNYTLSNVAPGNYLLRASSNQHRDELYDDVPCASANPVLECNGGSIISVTSTSGNRVIDIGLLPSASIAGRVVSGGSALSTYATLYLLDAAGAARGIWSVATGSDGSYRISDVPPGDWIVAISADSTIPQLYSGIDCPAAQGSTSFGACNLAAATHVVTVSGNESAAIDFNLRRNGSQTVRVVNDFDDQPLAGVLIDVWNASGRRVDSRITGASGLAYPVVTEFLPVPADHSLSTDNLQGLINQVYDGILCPNGSVFFGSCTLAGATPVVFPAPVNAPLIQIRLARPVPIFGGNFEQ